MQTLKAVLGSGLLTDDQEQMAERIITAIEEGNIPKNVSKEIMKQLKAASNPVAAFAIMRDSVPDIYLYERKEAVLKNDGIKEVILSCYLKGQRNDR